MRNIDIDGIGKRIKELRLECGMSQVVLAKKVGIVQNTLSQYENGKKPGLEVLAKLAIELKTTTDYLLGLED